MYSRALRRILNVSAKLGNRKDLQNITLISPSLVLARQQILSCASIHVSTRSLSEDVLRIPKETEERKKIIDEDAQREIDAMLNDNPELEKLKKIIELEISVMKQNGLPVPEEIRPVHWSELLKSSSRYKRQAYLEFLFKIEKKNENRRRRQEEKNINYEKYKLERDEAGVRTDVMDYRIGRNSLFRRITEVQMNPFWKWNGLKATMWGNKIVFDFSYEQYMKPQEIRSCAKQIMESYALNRLHNYPYDVYLCNVDFQGYLFKSLIKFIPSLLDNDFPWTVTEKSYVDCFDKRSLVYLSGHTNEVLEKYNANSVYIIGAFVDKSFQKPMSLAKAKEQGIRTAKLPIDKYVHFGDGSNKNLTLNQMMGIMLDVQCCSWEKALEHIPRRKLFENRVRSMEKKMQRELLRYNLNAQGESAGNKDMPLVSSSPVLDYSFNARLKLRSQYNKKE